MPLYSALPVSEQREKHQTAHSRHREEKTTEQNHSGETPPAPERPQKIKMHSKAAFQRLEILKGR